MLYTRLNAAGTRRSTAAPDQNLRRPPLTAEPSPPVILVAPKTLKSVEHDLLSLLPHLALAAGEPLAGKRRARTLLYS